MPRPTKHLHLDFETYCDLDLRKVGVYRYTEHASFLVLCVGWKWAGVGEAARFADKMPLLMPDRMMDPDVQIHAWNAAFETAVLWRLGFTTARPISCTMQRALAYGLPGRLEAAAKALGVPIQKDMDGHKLMMKLCRPMKDGGRPWVFDHDRQRLGQYCANDAATEESISDVIPPLPPDEEELAVLDARMNVCGGLRVDLPRVVALGAVGEAAEKQDAARCALLTGGAVTSPGTQTARLLAWLQAQGLNMPDVARATVEEVLAEGVLAPDSPTKEVLEIRLRTAKGSTKKLRRMTEMARVPDGALEGQFQFCGAGRTGRWAGRGVQLQNLPRIPKGFSPDLFTEMAWQPYTHAELDMVAPAPVLDCVSWSLRSCLKLDSTSLMWGFDFSQIEARVLAWLAGQQDILDIFASGQDVYVWAANQFGSDNRQLGKVLVLALGFGMGATKLRETAKKIYGVPMTLLQSEAFKNGWRAKNNKIVNFWYDTEAAAKLAILNRGTTHAVGGAGIAFHCTARTLQMRLPSGRVLYYHAPRINRDDGSIEYWGVELNQWTVIRTWGGKLAENATQAVARDVMSEAMLRLWRRAGLVPCMTVHDELVYPWNASNVPLDLEHWIREAPMWAGGLPIAGESKLMTRYGVSANATI